MTFVRKVEIKKDDLRSVINEAKADNNSFASSFVSNMSETTVGSTFDLDDVNEWLGNPDQHQSELEALAVYLYHTNPTIFQMVDMAEIIPALEYSVKGDKSQGNYTETAKDISKMMRMVHHKQLTRDIITQTIISGTTCGVWLNGESNIPEAFIFNDLEFVYPAYIRNNEWVLWLDMTWLDSMEEVEREGFFEMFKGVVDESDYNEYLKNTDEKQFFQIPQERSFCVRTHTGFRNQRFGISWVTQSLMDYTHRNKLRDLENIISNQILSNVAVFTIGSKEYPDSKLGVTKKRTVFNTVKNALQNNTKGETTVLGIPHWTKLEFPEVKIDGLDPKKFEDVSKNLNFASGGLMSLLTGKVNDNVGELMMNILSKKTSVILEQIESFVYQKLINEFVVSNGDKFEYWVEYKKTMPVDDRVKFNVLSELTSSFGLGLKPLLDELGVDYNDYIEDTLYEQEVLDLPNKIRPYQSTHTQSGSNDAKDNTDKSVEKPPTEEEEGDENDTEEDE